MTEELVDVKVVMKDGQRKTGTFLNGLNPTSEQEEGFYFVCNSQLRKYIETANKSLIELLPISQIKLVEAYLK